MLLRVWLSAAHTLHASPWLLHARFDDAGRASGAKVTLLSVVLMHALKVAVPLECKVLFIDTCLRKRILSKDTFQDRRASGRRRGGIPPTPPLPPAVSQQVAGSQTCQPIFINISDYFYCVEL
ncbi:hypothetical protein FQA47_012705 [Oryzias melastigma]|uniref:Uncharacterized protein n=1 Tax=Oryzias melastigma TaxID=30732 RepID=A0A834FHF3_ORYME|nr:hypothetical protein FQA47_012705 [Oryzias melastigma]